MSSNELNILIKKTLFVTNLENLDSLNYKPSNVLVFAETNPILSLTVFILSIDSKVLGPG